MNELANDENQRPFLMAIRQIAKARGVKVSDLVSRTSLSRLAVYHALSDKGNPSWTTLKPILSALGIQIKFAIEKSA